MPRSALPSGPWWTRSSSSATARPSPGLAADLASYAQGAALAELRLARLFDPADPAAARLTQTPIGVLTSQLDASPLGQVVTCRNGARETLPVDVPIGLLVSLKLQRRPARGGLTRAFDLPSGWVIHQAAAAARDSRLELTAVLLGRLGCSDTAPMLAAMAEEQADASLRWQSMKECLGPR